MSALARAAHKPDCLQPASFDYWFSAVGLARIQLAGSKPRGPVASLRLAIPTTPPNVPTIHQNPRCEVSSSDNLGADPKSFNFGGFRLFPDRQMLLHDGQPVALGGRAFDILTLLVTRAGDVVSKGELFEHVWPGYIVHDHNLKVNVGTLRRILAEADPTAEYIATIAGRGYKFVAAVVRENVSSAPEQSSSKTHYNSAPNLQLLFGRDDAIEQIFEQLQQPGYLTIVGPGGAGKTSLAVAVARKHHDAHDRIAFVDLSTVTDPRFAVPAIASALGVSLGLEDPIAGVIDLLRQQKPMLIIDNCEHVIATVAAIVERISAELPDARIIATSRAPLRTRSERIHFLSGLAYPVGEVSIRADEALKFPAVQLFLAKAGGGDAGRITDEYARNIVSICARLEGLALAIELAAGTARALAPSALEQFFRNGFETMNRGPREAPLRHQTLEATLDWSYRLLPDHEAVLLGLLSVFSGKFGADDAEALYPSGGLQPMAGRDALSQLVAKSLVATELESGKVYYRLAESTKAYAARRLFGAAHREDVKRRFALHIKDKMVVAEREWSSQTSRTWLQKYKGQIDDVRAVISWAFDPSGDAAIGVELVVAALPLWQELSAFKELLAAIELADVAGAAVSDLALLARAKLSTARAWAMTLAHEMHPQTGSAWRESIHDASLTGDQDFQLQAVCGQAVFLTYSGRPRAALRSLKSHAAASGLDWSSAPDGKRFLAHAEVYAGYFSSASVRLEELTMTWGNLEEGKRLSRFQVELPVAIGLSHGFLLWLQGEPERAYAVSACAVDRAADLGHMISLGNALCLAALPVAYLTGDLDAASRFQHQLADVSRRESIGIYEGTSRFFSGAIQAAEGAEAGLLVMEQSINDLVRQRWLARTAFYRSLLAEAWAEAGDTERARKSLRAALLKRDLREERWCHPELWRVAGVIEARSGQPDMAARYFEKSLARATALGAEAAVRRTQASRAALL